MRSDGTIEHYRDALQNRDRCNTLLAKAYPVALLADVASFFRNTRVGLIERILPHTVASQALVTTLTDLEGIYGYALPEGYSAARCLANWYLAPVDTTIHVPFTRWVDDYVLYCESKFQAASLLMI